ncbi:hypothetical protein ABBQ38_010675 [Trebouxia sp. C0009 RCD-2024]
MAPKKAKKTKQQLEEERKQAEEAARLAQEEQLRLEAQEQARQAAEEEKRQQLIQVQTEQEDARLASEREQLVEAFAALDAKCAQERQLQREAESWERTLQCSPLPDISDAPGLHAYFAEATSRQHKDITSVLHTCQEYCTLIRQSQQQRLAALQTGDENLQQHCQKCVQQWRGVMNDAIDAYTACILQCDKFGAERLILQNMEDYQEDASGIQVFSQTSSLKYGLWINTTKNPRLKAVEFPQLGISLEIPKLIALASVAVRVQWRESDEHLEECTTNLMAMGGVLHLDILSLPMPACQSNGWTLRAVTPDTQFIHRLAYPMPPAGADPETWVPEEEPQPIGISIALPHGSILPGTSPQAAFWDGKAQAWSTEGMSGGNSSDASGVVAFHSKTVGRFAVVSERTGLLPYQEWHVRPTGGQFGAEATVAIQTSNPEMALGFQVTKQGIQLVEPRIRRLDSVRGRTFSAASALLFELMQLGVYLVPQLRDAGPAGLGLKAPEVARAMCDDVALLASTHLITGSRWNKQMGPEVCLCRISKVVDWTEGGRTEAAHVKRIFSREHSSGPHQVSALMRRGVKGVAFADALDKNKDCPAVPEYGMPEYDSKPLGRLYASMPALLSSTAALQEVAEDTGSAPEAVLICLTFLVYSIADTAKEAFYEKFQSVPRAPENV